eukprot:GEMP01067228.1.p1 GENE.GEMP01067228.1~~GEMP01067228.1.p1  ORF type:complete len:118 (+),score=3.61 GEMP01067228.1:116-469(+)
MKEICARDIGELRSSKNPRLAPKTTTKITTNKKWTHPTSNYQLDLRVNRADLQNYRITLEEIDLFATNATVTVESLGNNVFKQWHSRSIHVSGPRGGMKGTPHERECEPKHEPRKKK